MQSMQSSCQQNVLANAILDPRKSILPAFDDDNDSSSDPRSTYILDFDLPEFDAHLFPSPQFEAFFTGSSLGDKTPTSPQQNVELIPPLNVKHNSFAELEADCSALQLDSEVIVLTRSRTVPKLTPSYPRSLPVSSPPRTSSPARPLLTPPEQPGIIRRENKYQWNAPPHLQLKASNHDQRRRFSRRLSARIDARILSTHSSSPILTPLAVSYPDTPISTRAFRFSYASSKRSSKIYFSTKELHRRRILKLQRTFGEHVPLELVAVSQRRRRRPTSRPLSIVSHRGPYPVMSPPGSATNTLMRDWSLDRIAPPEKAKTPSSVFKLSVVSDLNMTGQKNILRKSRAAPHEDILEKEYCGDNSIWLDEVQPSAPRTQPLPSAQLISFRSDHREYESLAASRAVQVDDDEQPGPSQLISTPLYASSESPEQDTSSSPICSSSPSIPVFCHGSDSDHAHLHHPPPKLSAASPATLVMLNPALYWPRMPFNVPVTQSPLNSARAETPIEQQYMGEFLDVPEDVSTGRRSERRQGWSGEWNQPSIQDVIQKLRNM